MGKWKLGHKHLDNVVLKFRLKESNNNNLLWGSLKTQLRASRKNVLQETSD